MARASALAWPTPVRGRPVGRCVADAEGACRPLCNSPARRKTGPRRVTDVNAISRLQPALRLRRRGRARKNQLNSAMPNLRAAWHRRASLSVALHEPCVFSASRTDAPDSVGTAGQKSRATFASSRERTRLADQSWDYRWPQSELQKSWPRSSSGSGSKPRRATSLIRRFS